MKMFPEPMSRVLRDFCHVEWYEVAELAEIVRSGAAKFDVAALKSQIEATLANSVGIADPINKLTANEFESDVEARAWLEDVYQAVFQ
jgi:hypothetical protein